MIHSIAPFGCKSCYPKSSKPFTTLLLLLQNHFPNQFWKMIIFSILFCIMISEGRFFSFFESSTNRRKTRGKKGENRWYLDLNNPQLILRKYQWYKKPAAVAEFYGTRFPFYHPSSLFCGIIDSRDLWEYTVTKYYENVLLRLQGREEGNQLGKKSLVMLGVLLHVEVEM